MLTESYCIIDNFGKLLEKDLGEKKLLGSTKIKNITTTPLSEIATITLFYHYSGYKNLNGYYEKHVKMYLKNKFPSALNYSRMSKSLF